MTFEQLNKGWNAHPNAPEVEVTVCGSDVTVSFLLNPYQYDSYHEGDLAHLHFSNALQYRLGAPNDEGFYSYNQSRFKKHGVKWGEFYLVHDSDWQQVFPNPVSVSVQPSEGMKHYLFYFRDETFECIAESYTMEIERVKNDELLFQNNENYRGRTPMKTSKWVIWLSIFGFAFLLASCVKCIVSQKPIDMNKWILLVGKFFCLFFLCLILPAAVLMLLQGLIAGANAFLGELFLFVVWGCVYLCGVFAANSMFKWRARTFG